MIFNQIFTNKYSKPVLPTPMAKCTCTPSCHVDELADRASEMLTKTNPRAICFKMDPY